ncbi:MAG: hypothetical protein A2033_10445 [Bacteroidetes bacterium GWA2_31_9]|nr:MAG: hypothetical protein A2033_10445 [Bacteroidetes bacterium GWA2_31_9]
MIFSKTTEYAIRILTYMATDYEKLYSAKSIVDKLNIPNKYMRRIMTNLSKSNFIMSIQGRDGGYKFIKSPDNIYLAEIIDSVDGIDKYMGCVLGFNECSPKSTCAMHKSWTETKEKLYNTLSKTSLSNLIKNTIDKF